MSEIHEAIGRWANDLRDLTAGHESQRIATEMLVWLNSPAADFVAVPLDKIKALRRADDSPLPDVQMHPRIVDAFAQYGQAIDAILACALPPKPKDDEILTALLVGLRASMGIDSLEIEKAIALRERELEERA